MDFGREKKKPNIIILVLIFLLMVSLTTYYLLRLNYDLTKEQPQAQAGVLDLSDWDTSQILDLDGQWEFYPGEIIRPGEELPLIREFIQVPGSWVQAFEGNPEGFGTYRLVIKVPSDGHFGIKTKTLRVASEVYANDYLVASLGQIAKKREDLQPESRYRFTSSFSKDGEIEILMPMSSYNYKSGGIISSIEFGDFSALQVKNRRARVVEIISITTFYIFGIYFLYGFFFTRRPRYYLFFGLSFSFMAFYFSIMNEQILELLFNYSFILRLRMQVLSMGLAAFFLLLAVHLLLEEYSNEKVVRLIAGLSLVSYFPMLLDYSFLSPSLTLLIQSILVVSFLLNYFYIFKLIIRAIRKKDRHSEYLWFIGLSYVLYWIIIGVKIIFEIDTGEIQFIIMAFLYIGIGLLISYQQQEERGRLEALTNRLSLESKLRQNFLKLTTEKLRLPLSNMEALISSIYEGKQGPLNPGQYNNLYLVSQEMLRLRRLVEDIRQASDLSGQDLDLETSSLDVYELVDSLVAQLEPRAKSQGLELYNDLEKDFPLVEADAARFTQALYNLLYNALENTQEGQIRIQGEELENRLRISIVDSGRGMDAGELANIFEIFYKGQDSQGLGLGLTVAKKMIELQGGRLEVSSQLGQGSTFSLVMPPAKAKRAQAPSGSLKKKKKEGDRAFEETLLFTGTNGDQEFYKEIFKDENFRLVFASSEKEALELIDKLALDMMVVDFTQKYNSCSQLCMDLRERYSMVELPILALVSHGARVDFERLNDFGINEYLRTPFQEEELLSRVKSLLMMKSSMKEGLDKELRYFYSQISPHFLYNTLNSIILLSYKDEEKTRQALYNLSVYFRGKLDLHKMGGLISLKRELELVEAYLEIEKLRFDDRLEMVFDIEEDVNTMIPPLTIQPLVENAIRHGLRDRDKGWIRVLVKRDNASIIIEVEDNGQGMDQDQIDDLMESRSSGLGLSNAIEKLKMLRNSSFEISSQLGQGTKIRISLAEVRFESDNT